MKILPAMHEISYFDWYVLLKPVRRFVMVYLPSGATESFSRLPLHSAVGSRLAIIFSSVLISFGGPERQVSLPDIFQPGRFAQRLEDARLSALARAVVHHRDRRVDRPDELRRVGAIEPVVRGLVDVDLRRSDCSGRPASARNST